MLRICPDAYGSIPNVERNKTKINICYFYMLVLVQKSHIFNLFHLAGANKFNNHMLVETYISSISTIFITVCAQYVSLSHLVKVYVLLVIFIT